MSFVLDGPVVGTSLVTVAGAVVVAFFILLHSASAVLLLRAIATLRQAWRLRDDDGMASILASEALPTVSVVVTGDAPRQRLVESLRALLDLRYPRFEVVLVHDGALSGQLPTLIDEFALYPVPPAVLVNVPTGPVRGYYRSRVHGKLFVIDKESRGTADALNAAVNASRYPYVLTMTAATMLTRDALERLMRPFLIGERVAAVAAAVRLEAASEGQSGQSGPPGQRAPTRAQRGGIEAVVRLREHVFLRLGWNDVGGQLPPPGAILVHRREHLLELDGYRSDMIDPVMDLVARLRVSLRRQRMVDAIPTIPDAVAYTTIASGGARRGPGRVAPARLLVEVLRARRGTDLRMRHRPVRLLAAVHLVAGVVLAPFVELAGYLLLVVALFTGGATAHYVPLFLLAVPGFALLLSCWVIALEMLTAGEAASWRAALGLTVLAAAEQLGYRQWRVLEGVRGVIAGIRGGRHEALDAPGPLGTDEHRALSAPDRVRAR